MTNVKIQMSDVKIPMSDVKCQVKSVDLVRSQLCCVLQLECICRFNRLAHLLYTDVSSCPGSLIPILGRQSVSDRHIRIGTKRLTFES